MAILKMTSFPSNSNKNARNQQSVNVTRQNRKCTSFYMWRLTNDCPNQSQQNFQRENQIYNELQLQWLFHDILNRNFPKTVLQPRELDVVKALAVKTLFWNKCVQALVDMGLHGHHAAVAIQNQNQTLEVLGHHFYRVSFRTLPPLF